MEGLAPDACPHHKWVDIEPSENDDTGTRTETGNPTKESISTNVHELHHGRALSLSEASVISVSGPSQLIVLAGERESGKTTLLSSLYSKFLREPFCEIYFAGSLTLPGFEQRCFDARPESGRDRPHTQHTSVGEKLRILHLCLVNQRSKQRLNLLLGDLAGEWYRDCRRSTSDAQELHFLRKTDRMCLLLDGKRLSDSINRQSELSDAEGTMRSLIEAGVLGMCSKIDVVCSKWDLIYKNEKASSFVQHAFNKIRQAFQKNVAELNFDKIAARPDTAREEVPLGFGLDILISRWTAADPPMVRVETPLSSEQESEREFCRFARRYPMRSIV